MMMKTNRTDKVYKSTDFHNIKNLLKESNEIRNYEMIGDYKIEKTLGEGTFGKVKLGLHIPTNEKVAIKVLEKNKIVEPEDLERVNREIRFLKKLKNKNIIKIYEILENSNNYYIIMEYASGGELFNYIVKRKRLEDDEASYFFYQIINGLEYIHKNNIVHRDLKPENLLLNEKKMIKIIDFGLSNQYKHSQLLDTPCGSPCYAAPEMILGKRYTGILVDIWSTGIILYAMICGFLPFEDKNNDRLYKKIIDCKLEFPNFVSDFSKNFIKKLLTVNPQKRINLEEIKEHDFYKLGEKQMYKEKMVYNKEGLKKKIIDKMNKLGYTKQEILINLEKNKHNSITTTFHLLSKRYKKIYLSSNMDNQKNEEKHEDRKDTYTSKHSNDLNQNINININYLQNVGNININISDPNKTINKENDLKNNIVGQLLNNDTDPKIDEISNYITEISKLESSNAYYNKDKTIIQSNSSFEIETLMNTKKFNINQDDSKFRQTKHQYSLRKKNHNYSNSEQCNFSIDNNKLKSKLVNHHNQKNNAKNNLLSNIKNQIYETNLEKTKVKKDIQQPNQLKSISKEKNIIVNNQIISSLNGVMKIKEREETKKARKLTQLLEYPNNLDNLNNINEIKVNDLKNAKNSKRDNRINLITLSENELIVNAETQNKYQSPYNKAHPLNLKNQKSKNSKREEYLKANKPSLWIQPIKKESNISFKPLKHYSNSLNAEEILSFPLTTKHNSNKKNQIKEYINNTSYSQNTQQTEQSCMIYNSKFLKNDFINSEKNNCKSKTPKHKLFIDKPYNVSPSMNSKNCTVKTLHFSNKPKTAVNHKNMDSTYKKKTIDYDSRVETLSLNTNISYINDNQFHKEKSSEILTIKEKKISSSNFNTHRDISLDKKKFNDAYDFACCTINNPKLVKETLSRYCSFNNIILTNISPNRYECKKDGICLGVEITSVGAKAMKFLKFFYISGDINKSKDLIKNFIINIGM